MNFRLKFAYNDTIAIRICILRRMQPHPPSLSSIYQCSTRAWKRSSWLVTGAYLVGFLIIKKQKSNMVVWALSNLVKSNKACFFLWLSVRSGKWDGLCSTIYSGDKSKYYHLWHHFSGLLVSTLHNVWLQPFLKEKHPAFMFLFSVAEHEKELKGASSETRKENPRETSSLIYDEWRRQFTQKNLTLDPQYEFITRDADEKLLIIRE